MKKDGKCLLIVDAGGNILHAGGLVGSQNSELHGKNFAKALFAEKASGEISYRLEKLIASDSNSNQVFNLPLVDQNGISKPMQWCCSVVKTPDLDTPQAILVVGQTSSKKEEIKSTPEQLLSLLASQLILESSGQYKTSRDLLEKEALLKEIHHRVKNNLQLISSLLKLSVRRAKHLSTEELVWEVSARVQSIGLVYELLYQANDFRAIQLDQYIKSLSQNLIRYYNKSRQVSLKIDADQILLNLESSVPFALILNELVSNCLKHAFLGDKSGSIFIKLKIKDKDCFTLIIEDTGPGLPDNFDFDKNESLGLELVKKLVRQLNGSMKIESTPSAKFILTFSLKGKHCE